ncbi:MAG: hypothetical protein QOG96_4836, partial [Pseudonocardiales bacterium]|nr:hypothetical protein [Pseudonocardiales bacterium]
GGSAVLLAVHNYGGMVTAVMI